jgi:tetratricopeptide (TPR) repeat protein
MKDLKKYVALISGLMLLSGQPVMASWLDILKGGKKPSPEEIRLEPEKYCIEYYQKGRFDSVDLIQACRTAAQNDPSFYYYIAMAYYLSDFGSNLEVLWDYLKKARQALEAKQDAESKQKLSKVYFAIATLYEKHASEVQLTSDKDFRDIARKYYERALALAEETEEKNVRAFALTRLGGYYAEKADLEKAEMYLQQAVRAWEEVKRTVEFDKNWLNSEKIKLHRSMGTLAYNKKNYDEAEEHFKKVLDMVRRYYNHELPKYWNWYAVWLYRMGKYDEAEDYLKKAIRKVEWELKKLQERRFQVARYEFIKRLENLALWYENLAEVYIKKNDLERARQSLLEANKRYKELEKEYLESEREGVLMFGTLGVGSTAKSRQEIREKIEGNESKLRHIIEMSRQGR